MFVFIDLFLNDGAVFGITMFVFVWAAVGLWIFS